MPTASTQVLSDGTIFLYSTSGPTGTGVFQPIVGIQANGTEQDERISKRRSWVTC